MVTIQDIENHKLISKEELDKDLARVKNYNPAQNKNNSFGNRFLYHFQLKNILKCHRHNKPSIYEIFADPYKLAKFSQEVDKRNRGNPIPASNYFECYRANHGSVSIFKTTTAMYLYHKYAATSVLDPTAGWGGRMLGAWALDIAYTGIDTNTNMRSAYDAIIQYLNKDNLKIIWDSCLNVDFSNIDYDFVLTSPPYVNLELYENMPRWASNEVFYKDFFIPLWHKCYNHIKPNGHIAFNISHKMYDDALKYGLTASDIEEDLKQNFAQRTKVKKQDKIYIWKKNL